MYLSGRQAGVCAPFKPHVEDGRPIAVFVLVPLSSRASEAPSADPPIHVVASAHDSVERQ
jgi:hypothetical protein